MPSNERLPAQEVFRLAALPDEVENGKIVKRYMSQRSAWYPEGDVSIASETVYSGLRNGPPKRKVAFGGHVYSQAGIAASKALADMQTSRAGAPRKEVGIHVSHPSPST